MTALRPDPVADLSQENARLVAELHAMRDRQAASAEILRAIASASGDAGRALQQIAETSARLFGAPSVSLQLAENGEWTQAYRFGKSANQVRLSVPLTATPIGGRNLPGTAIAENRQIHIPDLDNIDPSMADWPGLPPARAAGTRTMCGTPLRREGNAIGVLIVYRDRLLPFTEEELALQQSFADQAVIAIENARLFNETEKALQQQTATADVLKVISRSAFDLDTVMNTLARSAAALCGADIAGLFLRNDDFLTMRGISDVDVDLADFLWQAKIPIDDQSYMGRSILNGTIANIPDFPSDTTSQVRAFQQALGFKALLIVPLMREGRGIGVFTLCRKQAGAFPQRQIELVQTFADQAVIAIENARLFDEVQARTKELAASLDELRTAQDRLVQTEKLASLGQLTAGIAHEIKNPLNFVNNFAAVSAELIDELNELLKPAALAGNVREEIDELTGLLKDNLGKVVQHGKRADSIVKNMLLHSRHGSGTRSPSDINALLEESLNLAYHGARAEKPQFNVTLHRDFDRTAGMIELFPQEITRVFLNLISNGFYAAAKRKTENGGSAFEPVLSAATRNLGYAVEIRIRDNGTGIPSEVKEKIFNPFFTTKPAGEGTGLGLSMSHDIIVKQHGGRIDVETEPGEFTEFRIVLPRTTRLSDRDRGPA